MLPAKQRRQLREIIEQELEKLEESLKTLRDQTQPVAPDASLGRLTRMEALVNQGTAENLLASAQRRRTQLKAQLDKMNRPEYGVCVKCQQPIPIERLKAVPDAVMCVPCLESLRKR